MTRNCRRPATMAPDEEAVYNFASELLDTKYVSDPTFNAAAKLLGEYQTRRLFAEREAEEIFANARAES